MVCTALGCLVASFINLDFSVLYVASNANSALPLVYRVAAVWGAHEGSLLLWIFLLGCWTVAVAIGVTRLPKRFGARVLGVLGIISFAFLLFALATSNPFTRLIPAAPDGRDLNPLLQDPALAIHPPMLYTGYVGFSVAFAFACAAMLEGKMDQTWARWTRPWTTAAWGFLSMGNRARQLVGVLRGSAGAATGSGTRWKTRRSCHGSPARHSFTRWRSPTSAGSSRAGRCCSRFSRSR